MLAVFSLQVTPQWGKMITTGHGYMWVGFPLTYSHQCLITLRTYLFNGGYAVGDSRGIYGINNSGFYCSYDCNYADSGAYWLSLGK